MREDEEEEEDGRKDCTNNEKREDSGDEEEEEEGRTAGKRMKNRKETGKIEGRKGGLMVSLKGEDTG